MQGVEGVTTELVEIPVQNNGGFQNTFLFAEKKIKEGGTTATTAVAAA
jgi:hypothetical protein